MTIAPSTATAWEALPLDSRVTFYDIASKESSDMTAAEWFDHLVPSELQDNPQEIEVFMNGGTVTQEVWVSDQGVANGHYEQVSYHIPDKDVSRIQSGHNGGEYTADNTVMEDASINRARGLEDMTSTELAEAQEVTALEAELIDGGEIILDSADAAASALQSSSIVPSSTVAAEAAGAGNEFLGAAGELLTDALAPAIGATLAAQAASNQFESTKDKVGYGALAAGGAALVCMTPPGQAGLALYGGYKLTKRVCTWLHNWKESDGVQQWLNS